jgi:hypothetical protein
MEMTRYSSHALSMISSSVGPFPEWHEKICGSLDVSLESVVERQAGRFGIWIAWIHVRVIFFHLH